jgi:hypothetical protein
MCYKGKGGIIGTRPYRRLLRGKGLHQHWRTENSLAAATSITPTGVYVAQKMVSTAL